jgi:hypothetical protein
MLCLDLPNSLNFHGIHALSKVKIYSLINFQCQTTCMFFESGVYSCILFREKYLVFSKAQNLCLYVKIIIVFNNDFFNKEVQLVDIY